MKSKYEYWKDRLLEIKGWARDGLTDDEIAKKLSISIATLYNWKNLHLEFSKAIKDGRAPVNVEVEDTFFEKKLNGYFIEEEVQERCVQKDASGNVKGTTDHIRKYKRYIPPDTTALIFYLKCRLSHKYNDKLNVVVDDRNGILEDLIKGLKDDIHEETAELDEAVADEPSETN